MKEVRFFYTPNAPRTTELPDEEAQHAVRVLRLKEGDEIILMDGMGMFYRAAITEATKKRCTYEIVESMPQQRQWTTHLHVAMAPTKSMDRTEWLAEKATEIGVDELSFLRSQFSERTQLKVERIEKIVVAAMKQSHKAWCPVVHDMMDFKLFVTQDFKGDKFICHCYDQPDMVAKVELKDVLVAGHDALVLIGPEGDFSVDEVKMAEAAGFVSVSLGKSRLRTETAALVAVHLMQLKSSLP